ncbi:AAA family ATPase [Paralimibaculum aggregatum]|uniref:AAA family ATPase n=2 Tax=Paralimibaculum aggregatum TaxID=3036245 RepID=A0ABQ6LHA9_9RHOB|nr:AAA family ATPase [Limibaculum sp. NKW23]
MLTIMFSDLMGSTNLSMVLDPEDMREVLRRYQEACAAAITGHDGMIANYLGDGVLAYFGYPMALEDAAIRAADAARRIVAEAARIDGEISARMPARINVRVALHAGMVLVGEMGSGEARDRHSVVGALPNVAARLQELAPTNGVVISDKVRRRLGDAFEVTPMGAHRLKGVSGEVKVYGLGPRRRAARPDADGAAPEIYGRAFELGLLHRTWETHRATGRGGIVTVEGEPGVGKSGLLRRFLHDLAPSGPELMLFNGAIADREAPFSSLWSMLDRHHLPAGAAGREAREAALLDWFAAQGCAGEGFRAAVLALRRSALHHLEDRGDAADLRADIFAAFRRYLAGRARPLLVVLEDAHWIDPSTLEMIDGALRAGHGDPDHLMLVMTRTGRRFPWSRRSAMNVALSGLDEDACHGIVRRVAGGVPPDRALTAQIAALANGLPLFVEEMARMLIQRDLVKVSQGRLRMRDIAAEMPTPGTLMDLLTARLDSLGDAKPLAQAAAVLGRIVTAEALAAVMQRSADRVDEGLGRLLDATVLEPDRSGTRFQFRHALFQKAAYETLLKSRRALLHGAFVDWLQSRPPGAGDAAPEILAWHCFGARRHAEAAAHYRDAGLLAARTGANREAAAHFKRALEATRLAAPDAAETAAVLELQVRLAGALLSADGPGAESTAEAYETAIGICERVPESRWHFPAYWGWWRISTNFPVMSRRAARIVAVADRMQDPEFKLQALHCMWANTFQIGALDDTLDHAARGLALYRPEISAEQSILFGGHDCKVCGHGQIALTRWLKGEGDAAAGDVRLAIRHGEALGHEGSLLHALDIAVTLHCHLRAAAAMTATAARLIALGDTARLEEYVAKGQFFEGWAVCGAGDLRAGLGRMNAALAVLEAVTTNEDFPLFHSLRASAMRRLGDLDGAAGAIAAARSIIASEGVTYWAAEIERQEAETEMARAAPDHDAVAARLEAGRRIAHGQGALALALRNAQSAAAWHERQGAAAAAREALAPVLARFPAAAGGRDLADARAALARLGG